MLTITSKDLLVAARKAAAWLAGRQSPRGDYVGLEPPDEKGVHADTDDLGCYYKSIYTLRVAGESAAAGRGMNYVVERFMSPDGDFFNTPEVRSSGSYGPVYCQLYSNAWLMRAAAALRWYGLAKRILDFMLRYRTAQGGFYAQVNPATTVIDSNATAVCGLSCLLGGRPELAVESGDFLLKMLDHQEDPGKMFARWEDGKGLLTDTQGVAEKELKYWYIDRAQGQQAYWVWAWPMDFLLAVWEITKDDRYFRGALEIYDWLAGGHEDAFHFVTAGKGGWGSSMLYRITGEERYLKTCLSQMEFILQSQHADGFMLGPGVEDLSGQPIRTTFDFTADFTSWLVDAAAELATRE